MKNNEIASFDSFEILNFDELENLCGGERFGEQAEAGKQPASIAVTVAVAVLPVWKKYDIADRKCIHLPLDRWILFIKYKADEEYKIQGT